MTHTAQPNYKTMNTPLIYISMAQYNRWMNENLLKVSANFSDQERKQNRNVPFDSLHGVWNHLLLANRIWLARFENESFSFNSLRDEVCSDFDDLRREFAITDVRIEAFAASLTEEKMSSRLRFVRGSDGASRDIPFWIGVQQYFNHQTHHRGQISAIVEMIGGDCGVTDFVALPSIRDF